MNTSSKPSPTLYESEPRSLVLIDNISPIVESSSAKFESFTSQLSSASASQSVLNFEEKDKSRKISSPLSSTCVSLPVIAKHTPSPSVSPTSSASKLPTTFSVEGQVLDDPLEQEPECFSSQGIVRVLEQESTLIENMLSTTGAATSPNTTQPVSITTSSSNSPAPIASSCSSSLSPVAAIGCHLSNNINVQSIKCEPHLASSPTTGVRSSDNSNSQRVIDEAAIKTSTISDSSSLQRENSATQRKNSNSGISSAVNSNGSDALLHSSPTSSINNNDNSNSSNSAISQIMDSDPINGSVQQQPLHECNTISNSSVKGVSKTNTADDCNDSVNINPSASGNFANTCTTKDSSSSSTSSSSSSSSASGKNDAEIHTGLGNSANVKKEQCTIDTPEMSPDSFSSLTTLTGNNTTSVSGVGVSPGAHNNSNGKHPNVIGCGISLGGGSSCSGLLHDISSNGQQTNNNSFCGSVSIMPNSMDYMQQQNHIFVFSTQLANKGAESVLSGQFPTIIAYHCTQPATKKFLEDFFLKNPMKMAKIQRQNSLNMAISVSTGHQWVNANWLPLKNQQKINGRNNIGGISTTGNQICNNTCMDDKASTSVLSASSSSRFSDPSDSISGEGNLMNWDQSNVLENMTRNSNTGHSIKICESTDNIIGSPRNAAVATLSSIAQQSPNKLSIGANTAPVSPGDSMQPSLQGVKVPDENLTPQQRQHREEQLAKLKKMNQFLFPEHGGDLLPDSAALQGSNQLGKMKSDIIIGNSSSSGGLVGILGDSSNISSSIGVANMRGINNIGMGRGSGSMGRNSVALSSGLLEEGMSAGIIGGAGDINNLQCGNQSSVPNISLMNAQQGLPCGTGNILAPNTHVGGISSSHGAAQGGIVSHSIMVPSGMNSINNCGTSGALMLQSGHSKGISGTHQMDIGSGGPSQVEWSKMQHQFYEERARSGKAAPDIMTGITGLYRSLASVNGSYARPSQSGTALNCSGLVTSGLTGRSQGPPPPYHPTQRSASVPIATQSPNPSSPNNPTSNLSLPSPRTASGSCGTTLLSPSSDILVPTSSTTTSTTLATTLSVAPNLTNQAFQQEDSPTGPNINNINNGNNNLRNNLNQFNSNPSTPLSNLSPKDLETLSSTGISGDAKNPRPSPQRSRTPHVSTNSNTETTNIDARFPSASPGANFSSHIQNQGSGPKLSTTTVDNITSGQAPFVRRPDNLPLNPNSSRSAPIKQNHFDPISSLAQMSQQLTSCVSSNGGIGGPSNVGITNTMSNEIATGCSSHQNMEGLMGPSGHIEGSMDHCSTPGSSGGMGLPPHMMGGNGQYGASGCHMVGPIINPMGQRLLTPKMNVGFSGASNVIRDGPGFHGAMAPHRMMGRVGVNFCPFNSSPNIQVKASTPNTIQYMPARPQPNSINPRVPPSLEFLQRFTNPQLSGPNISENPMMSAGSVGNSDPNKISNASTALNMQNSGINFFQNCNQHGSSSTIGNAGNQGDIVRGIITGHSEMGVAAIGNTTGGIRGVRPMRQAPMGPGGSPVGGIHRMQTPGSHLIGGSGGPNQFSNNPHEVMECSDPNGIFGNAPGGPNQMFGPQQKNSPMGGQAHCQNMSPANIMNGSVSVNEQSSSMQLQLNGPGILGPNGNGPNVSGSGSLPGSMAGSSNSGPGNYKSFMSQSTNDLKYAQQYHNFQQQLYATTTRSHVNQQMGGPPSMGLPGSGINSGMPTNSLPGFFVSK